MTYPEFQDKCLAARRVNPDDVQGFQCVDLPVQFVRDVAGLTSFMGNGNAIDYVHPNSQLSKVASFLKTTDVRQADIVVLVGLKGNPWGHVGLGTGNKDGAKTEILEQNGQTGNGQGTGGDAIRTRFIENSRIAGVVRLNNLSAPAPVAAVPAPRQQTVTLPHTTSGGTWRAYRVGGTYVPGTEAYILQPGKYGDLTYPVVAWVANGQAAVIDTQMCGRVVVWTAGTDAIIRAN